MHFALRPDGVLFLGKAEMLLSHSSLFRPVEIKRRFFSKVPVQPRDRRLTTRPVPDLMDGDPNGTEQLRQAALMSAPQAQIVVDSTGRLSVVTNRAAYLRSE